MPKTYVSPLLTLEEAARYLRIEERTMRSIRQRGEIPVVRVSPGRIAFRIEDLDAYIAARVEQPRRRRKGRRS
jgi:excisionase family DNA binding protein